MKKLNNFIVLVAVVATTLGVVGISFASPRDSTSSNNSKNEDILRILNISNPEDEKILRKKSLRVSKSDKSLKDDIRKVVTTLANTPHSAGLSAIQVGIEKKIVVINWPGASEQVPNIKFPLVMLNPKIAWHSDENIDVFEGCLSVPYDYEKLKNKDDYNIKRYAKVKVRYFDRDFNEKIIESDPENPFFTKCLQHEIDHLDGILYIDHLPKERREEIIRLNREYSNPTKGDDL